MLSLAGGAVLLGDDIFMIVRKIINGVKRRLKSRFLSWLTKTHRKYIGYTPFYNRNHDIDPAEPELYSRSGRRLHVFFLANRSFAHDPYGANRQPEYIFWDRYNFGLKTHFYSEWEAFNLAGSPDRRFAMISESRSIIPACYDKFLSEKSYFENEFELVFTENEEILDSLTNARLVPFPAGYWCGRNDSSAIAPDNYTRKDKDISIIASNKAMCKMHLVRQETARYCLKHQLADTFGKFTGGGGGVRSD